MTEKLNKNQSRTMWGMGRVEFLSITKYIPDLLASGHPKSAIYRLLKTRHKLTLSQSCFYRHMKQFEKERDLNRPIHAPTPNTGDQSASHPKANNSEANADINTDTRTITEGGTIIVQSKPQKLLDPTINRKKTESWFKRASDELF